MNVLLATKEMEEIVPVKMEEDAKTRNKAIKIHWDSSASKNICSFIHLFTYTFSHSFHTYGRHRQPGVKHFFCRF